MLLLDELREAWRSESRDHRYALVGIVLIGVVLRAMYLRQPMRYDESVTYMYFVRFPWSDALSLYTYPNNHLFHTLLAKASVTVFGNSPWALRLPAFLAGTLIVPSTYAVARALYDGRVALFATALVGSSTVLVLYSTNARGYSLVTLAFLLLVLLAIRLMRGSPSSDWITFAVIAALGLWTIPVMLYPLGAVCLWFALSSLVDGKRAELRRLSIALGITAGLTLLAYSPVISREGIAMITQNKFVTPTGWLEFFDQLSKTMKEAFRSWGLGIPPLVTLPLLGCAVIALGRHASLSRFRVGLPLAAYVWSAWLLVVNHRAPFGRVWIWFLPVVAALAGAGLNVALQHWQRTRRFVEEGWTSALAVALSVGVAISIAFSFAVLLTRDTGTYREAEEAATTLRGVLRPGDRVLAALPSNGPLSYYLDRFGLPPEYLTLDEARANRIIAVVDQGEGLTLDRVVAHSIVRDSARFGPPGLVAEFPSSAIIMFQRKNVQAK